ncbi:PilZ domain-containing protein [Persephonella sp.]
MQSNVNHIFKSLDDEKEFFSVYQEKFAQLFANYMKEKLNLKISEKNIIKLGNDLYKTLFLQRENQERALYELSLKMYETKTEIKSVLSRVFMVMIKDFVDYLIQRDGDINLLKNFISLIDIYLQAVDKASIDYINSLETEIDKIKKENKEKESDDIITFLEAAKDSISIIDYYYEVPVICKGKLKTIKDKKAVFNVKNCIFKIFEKGHYVFIKVDGVKKSIKALIENIDYRFGLLTLTNFHFSEIPQEKRKYIRVRVKNKIPIKIHKEKNIIEGYIDDISVGGIGIFTADRDNLSVGDKIKAFFILKDRDFNVSGEVKYITPVGKMFRIGIQFLNLSVKDEEIIGEFVMKRQFEILKKLREL